MFVAYPATKERDIVAGSVRDRGFYVHLNTTHWRKQTTRCRL
jgi:hypothetical protein